MLNKPPFSLSPLEGERQPKLHQAILAERGGYDVDSIKEQQKMTAPPSPELRF